MRSTARFGSADQEGRSPCSETIYGVIAVDRLLSFHRVQNPVNQSPLQATHVLRPGEFADDAQVIFDSRQMGNALSDEFICCSFHVRYAILQQLLVIAGLKLQDCESRQSPFQRHQRRS